MTVLWIINQLNPFQQPNPQTLQQGIYFRERDKTVEMPEHVTKAKLGGSGFAHCFFQQEWCISSVFIREF